MLIDINVMNYLKISEMIVPLAFNIVCSSFISVPVFDFVNSEDLFKRNLASCKSQ